MSDRNTGAGETRRAATLELRNVEKRYPGQSKAAIEDLSLTVEAGEICARRAAARPRPCGWSTA
jgi:osmoprotectant transport system ATP-binding protein